MVGYLLPSTTTRVSSSWEDHKNRKPSSQEPGTDYPCPHGSPLGSPADGRVVDVKSNPSGATGKFITIDFDDGRRVRMLHLYRVLRNVGDRVRRGEQVAVSGASSWGSDWGGDAHVHITLWPTHRYVFGPHGTIDFEQYTEQNSGKPAGLDDDMGMTPEEWRQFQVLAGTINAIKTAVDNMNAWISEGGPGVEGAKAYPGTVAARVINLDRQVTGADEFDRLVGPTVAGRLIDVQKNTKS